MKAITQLGRIAALASGVVASQPASAQMNPIILAAPMNNSMGQIMALRARQMQSQFESRDAAPDTSRRPAPRTQSAQNLAIPADPAVTQQVHDLYIGDLAKSGGKQQAAIIDQRFGNVRATFAKMVTPYGLRADDLDDVMAAHLIVMWMAANQQSRSPTPGQAQGVRAQMRNVFASQTGVIAGASQRQSFAEYVMYETCMIVLTRQVIRGHPDLDKRVSDAVDAKMSNQGFSLRNLVLTEQGLVKG